MGTAGLIGAAPVLASLATEVQAAPQSSIGVEKDIVFGKGGDTDLKLDIYRPPAGTSEFFRTPNVDMLPLPPSTVSLEKHAGLRRSTM